MRRRKATTSRHAVSKPEAIDANGFYWGDRNLYPFKPIEREQVERAKLFLRHCDRSQRFGIGSYGLKHDIERALRNFDRAAYVSNGACIVAAIELGIKVEPAHQSVYVVLSDYGMIDNDAPLTGFVFITEQSVERVSRMMRSERRAMAS